MLYGVGVRAPLAAHRVISLRDNDPFLFHGFKEIGYKEDAWLVDGNSIGETVMTISVNT
ncbi:MAG: hypothetical protein QF472_06405 [Candidatus Marinimicrobia bacterium]|nr:hypothetical protein [Candidatus Neomarinimicrobiota bacterium]